MWDWISKLQELKNEGVACVLVTLTEHSGSSPREPGAKMIVLSEPNSCGSIFFGTIGGGHLEKLAIEEAKKILETKGPTQKIKYPLGAKTGQCCGGTVELLFEAIEAGPQLYLFGAGHVGLALCRALDGTPFKVHVIDSREEWISHESIPKSVIRHHCEWDEFVNDAKWDSQNIYVAVMTHDHQLDQAIVEDIVKRDTRYVGLIGSVSKWERFKQRFSHRGLDPALFEKVHCPIGINLGGGKTPAEVAISVSSEIIREHYRFSKIN